MEENVQKAYINLTNYTIKATEKVILELEKLIHDKANESIKETLISRRKELDKDLNVIRKFIER